MAADLRCAGWFQRQSLFLDDHELLVLEHEFIGDRVRRFRYDRLNALLLWRRMPWDHIVLATLSLSPAGGLLVAFAEPPGAQVFGLALLVLWVAVLVRAVAWQRTYVQLVRGSRAHVYATVTPRRRVTAFRDRLLAQVPSSAAPSAPSAEDQETMPA